MIIFIKPNGELVETELKTHFDYLKKNNLNLKDLTRNGWIQCNSSRETYIKFNRFIEPTKEQINAIDKYLIEARKNNSMLQIMWFPWATGIFYPTTYTGEQIINEFIGGN